jgi:hypothetical protein
MDLEAGVRFWEQNHAVLLSYSVICGEFCTRLTQGNTILLPLPSPPNKREHLMVTEKIHLLGGGTMK